MKSLMVLLMIVAASSSYCQYPVIKKIGNDSLILMTIKQGEDINKQFSNNQKKIDSLKDSIKVKKLLYDSLSNELNKTFKTKEEYKNRYEERLKMPIKYPYHDDGWDFAQKMVLVGIIVVQFFTIKR
jgi:hypothetical protein